MAKKLTPKKARQILHDKSVHGHPLTDKQRRFFGAIAGGAPMKAQTGLEYSDDLDYFGTYDAINKKGDYTKERQSVINQLSNLPIYSPEQRYMDYQTVLPYWKRNLETVPIYSGNKTPSNGSSYYGYGAPLLAATKPYEGTVQLDPRQFGGLQTPERVLEHELRHAAFDGRNFIPQFYGEALHSTSRKPQEFYEGAHENLLNERAVMALGTRKAIIDKYGLKPDAKIPRELFDAYNRETLETGLRSDAPPMQFSDIEESFRGARSASDVYDLINFNTPKKENGGWLEKYGEGGTMQEYQENYNNNTTSYPPGFVGMGNNTKGRNYSPAWGGQFQDGGEIPQAQRGISCPTNVSGCGDIGQQTGAGRFLSNIGDFLGVGHGEERRERRAERRLRRKERRDSRKMNNLDITREDLEKMFNDPSYTRVPSRSFQSENDYYNYHPYGRTYSPFLRPVTPRTGPYYTGPAIDTSTTTTTAYPGQGLGTINDNSIVSRYISPETNTPENIMNQGRLYNGVPGGVSERSVLTAAMGASIPGAVGFTYARTAGAAPSNGPYAKKTKASAQNGKKLPYDQWMNKYNLEETPDYNLKRAWELGYTPDETGHLPTVDNQTGQFLKAKGHPTIQKELDWYNSPEGAEFKSKNSIDSSGKFFKYVPKGQNGQEMSYYQHGLDWKPKSISKNGGWLEKYEVPKNQNAQIVLPSGRDLARQMTSASESTSLGISKRDAELQDQIAKRKAFEKYIGSQPQLKSSRKSTPAEEANRIRRNQEYVASIPNAQIDQFGNTSAVNRNMTYTGEPANFMGERQQKGYEHIMGALEAAGYAEGLGALGSAAKKAIAQSMESGLLSNTYKLNPWAFKPNPEAYYRMLGKEGYADALESGLLRSNPGKGGLQTQQFDDVYFSMKHPWDGRNYGYVTKSGNPIGGVGYEGPYMAELTGQELNHPISSFPRANMAQSKVPISLETPGLKLYKQDWLKGYKEVPKPTTGTLPPPQQAGFPNPLAIADAIVPRINPFSFIEDGGDLMSMSPLNFVPGYGKNLGGKNQAFRKFGNSIQDVIERQALSPKGGSPLRMGKSQIVSEGNWAAPDRPWEKYPGVFEATFDFTHPERNIGKQAFRDRSGVLITDRQGNPLPEIPLTEPGMSFNRRLPFSNRYVPIDKQKLIDNKFQLATLAPHLQSLAEKYGAGLAGATTLGAMGYPGAVEKYNQYTIDPIKEQLEKLKNSELYKSLTPKKKKKGGVIEDDMGQWVHPGKVTKINSNQITMKGVPYPVLGISDAGDQQMMYPEQEYTFKGKTVTEYPQKKKNGGWLDKYN